MPQQVSNEPISVGLSNSSIGALTLGILDDGSTLPDTLELALTQKLVTDAISSEFYFQIQSATAVISGRDSYGKNLRFDQAAIDTGRVQVQVNGVIKSLAVDYNISPNVITFTATLSAGDRVKVSIFSIPPTVTTTVIFDRNDLTTINRGAWGNIRYVKELDISTGEFAKKWILYTSVGSGGLSSNARYQISGLQAGGVEVDLEHAKLFLSASPYGNIDRNLRCAVKCSDLVDEYPLETVGGTYTRASVNSDYVQYLPVGLLLEGSASSSDKSFIVEDVLTSDSSNEETVSITSPKIIGPV